MRPHYKPKNKKRPRRWHHGPKEDLLYAQAVHRLDGAYKECVRCPDQAFRMVVGIGPLCECCFAGWWEEERLSG